MVSVKLLKPYYIKMNSEYIRIILAYQYFSLLVNKRVYHFVPIEGQEILVNRKTKQVINTETKFAFQHENDMIYITMKKLTTLTDFVDQLNEIIQPYYEKAIIPAKKYYSVSKETEILIKYLEERNIKRLIDMSLDNHDEETFKELTAMLT